jgi:hypothetical protein
MSLDYSKLPELANREPCGRCGRERALGVAYINGVAYCHGDHSQGNQTCYMRQTWELVDRHGPTRIA